MYACSDRISAQRARALIGSGHRSCTRRLACEFDAYIRFPKRSAHPRTVDARAELHARNVRPRILRAHSAARLYVYINSHSTRKLNYSLKVYAGPCTFDMRIQVYDWSRACVRRVHQLRARRAQRCTIKTYIELHARNVHPCTCDSDIKL